MSSKRTLIFVGIVVVGLFVLVLVGLPYSEIGMTYAQYSRNDDGPGEGFDQFSGGEAGIKLGNAVAAPVGGDGRRVGTAGCPLYDAPNGNVTPGQIGEAPLVGLSLDGAWYLIRTGGQQGVWVSASCAR